MKNAMQELEGLFAELGYRDFRWIDPRQVVVAQWVRMKCRFGCREYGRNASCPPNVPEVGECARFFGEYRRAAILRFPMALENPEERHAWSREVNRRLLGLERAVFLKGHPRAFLLFMDSCGFCQPCPGSRRDCRDPRSARPTPEAMAVDVFSTVRKVGFPIGVLPDYRQTMNRYAFLLVE
jgi:predicted metal-binding protein